MKDWISIKSSGEVDIPEVLKIKALIRSSESLAAAVKKNIKKSFLFFYYYYYIENDWSFRRKCIQFRFTVIFIKKRFLNN